MYCLQNQVLVSCNRRQEATSVPQMRNYKFNSIRRFGNSPAMTERKHSLTSDELRRVWQSDEWKEFVGKNLGDRCSLCGSKESLLLHHRTFVYKPKSYMDSSRVVIVCKRCHHLIHTHNVTKLEAILKKNRDRLQRKDEL